MPDSLTINRGRQVSRQLTDTERALDEDVASHLDSSRPQLMNTGNADLSYAWLRQDLADRAAMTQALQGERQLAAVSGGLQDMDRRFKQETQDEVDAIEAQKKINSLLASDKNMRRQDAVLEVTKDRPDYWGNKYFTDSEEKMRGMHETDMERQKREGDLAVSIASNAINTLTGTAKLEALRTPAGQEYLSKANALIMEKEMRGFPLDEQEDFVKREALKNDLKMQQMRAQELDFTDQTFEGKAKLAYFMEESGFEVGNLDKMAATIQGKKGVTDAIAHPTFLARNPQLGARLKSAIQTIERSDAKPDEIAKAEADMALVAGAHAKYVGQTALELQMEDRAQKFGADRGKSLQDVNEEVLSITTKNTEGKRSSTIPVEDEILNTYESWMKSQVASNPKLKPAYDKHVERIQKARSSKDAQEKVNAARYAAGDFAMEAAGADLSSTKEVTPKPSAGSPSPAPASPSGLKVGEERRGFVYKGGDPSKPESWTKKP